MPRTESAHLSLGSPFLSDAWHLEGMRAALREPAGARRKDGRGRGADGFVPCRGQAGVSPHLGLTCVFPPSPRDCQKCPVLLTGRAAVNSAQSPPPSQKVSLHQASLGVGRAAWPQCLFRSLLKGRWEGRGTRCVWSPTPAAGLLHRAVMSMGNWSLSLQ